MHTLRFFILILFAANSINSSQQHPKISEILDGLCTDKLVPIPYVLPMPFYGENVALYLYRSQREFLLKRLQETEHLIQLFSQKKPSISAAPLFDDKKKSLSYQSFTYLTT